MRPEALFPWFADIETLKGVGARTRTLFEKLAGSRVKDLLFHLPSGAIDRRFRPTLDALVPGSIATLDVTVLEHRAGASKKAPYRVLVGDASGEMTLVFFHARADYLQKQLPEGERRIISGKVEAYQGGWQMTHPDYIVDPANPDEMPAVEPVYPLTMGLSGKVLRKAILSGFEAVKPLSEWLDAALMAREGWPAFLDALLACHTLDDISAAEPKHPARTRLAYDELLANQLALALVREQVRRKRGRPIESTGKLTALLRSKLPYSLTNDQEAALADIYKDMRADTSMLRLLQGDVGSGKTVVALMAAAAAIEGGHQAALLAPTEILAIQHLESIAPLAEQAGIRVALLTGRVKGKAREGLLMALMAGEIDLLIGTHAIIQDGVVFKDLALAIIDEQHRFGVAQRAALSAKSHRGVDVLGMTATPIPRSLMLTAYGDMDTSLIREKPPGRLPIDTRVVSLSRLSEVAHSLGRAVSGGARVYWVCPLVDESEVSDLAAASERADMLNSLYPGRVGLVHGKMKPDEKDRAMAAFSTGEIDILVATTVIEVGVNVPEATLMIIEHAERFGLAQLHQLRGRVGRGDKQSVCLLLRSEHVGEVASRRLAVMRDTEDGFLIAEEDLRLRGGGEVLGTKQSGLPSFQFVDYEAHSHLLDVARDDAKLIVTRDAGLANERGTALRHLLYLFERDEGVRLMKSG